MAEPKGLRTRSRGGMAGKNTWSRRWLADMEALAATRRDVHVARSRARYGDVRSLAHSGRAVALEVAGSQPQPFDVRFQFRKLDAVDRESLRKRTAGSQISLRDALVGEGGEEVAFILLPPVQGATWWNCTCPVEDEVCQHVLAGAGIIAEWLDRDPSRLLALRGVSSRTVDDPGAARPADSGAVEVVAEWLWGEPGPLPSIPSPSAAKVLDLLDGPAARRFAAAASSDPVEQLRIIADLEDFHHAFESYICR